MERGAVGWWAELDAIVEVSAGWEGGMRLLGGHMMHWKKEGEERRWFVGTRKEVKGVVLYHCLFQNIQ